MGLFSSSKLKAKAAPPPPQRNTFSLPRALAALLDPTQNQFSGDGLGSSVCQNQACKKKTVDSRMWFSPEHVKPHMPLGTIRCRRCMGAPNSSTWWRNTDEWLTKKEVPRNAIVTRKRSPSGAERMHAWLCCRCGTSHDWLPVRSDVVDFGKGRAAINYPAGMLDFRGQVCDRPMANGRSCAHACCVDCQKTAIIEPLESFRARRVKIAEMYHGRQLPSLRHEAQRLATNFASALPPMLGEGQSGATILSGHARIDQQPTSHHLIVDDVDEKLRIIERAKARIHLEMDVRPNSGPVWELGVSQRMKNAWKTFDIEKQFIETGILIEPVTSPVLQSLEKTRAEYLAKQKKNRN